MSLWKIMLPFFFRGRSIDTSNCTTITYIDRKVKVITNGEDPSLSIFKYFDDVLTEIDNRQHLIWRAKYACNRHTRNWPGSIPERLKISFDDVLTKKGKIHNPVTSTQPSHQDPSLSVFKYFDEVLTEKDVCMQVQADVFWAL